jgi:peptide/nickel transport system substrate-binding protein
LKWSDGRPLTADDVIFTLDVIYDTKIQTNMRESMLLDVPDGKGGFKRVPLTYRKVDDRTIEFKFPVRYAPARDILSFPIAPRHKLEAAYKAGQPASTRFNSTWGVNVNVKELVSSGAWLLQEYVPGQRLVYVRNPNYWKKDDQGRPLPYLDRFVVIIVPTPTHRC